jgi:pimeloyl-ACP methyl ester carboxylesterase
VSLSVEATGSLGAPAIVFLHGVGAGGWMWWRQVPAFGDHLCLAVDLPAHGHSSDVPWASLAGTADLVAGLVKARTVTGTAHVVGLSLGGQVALALLDRHPGVVRRAVVTGVTAERWPNRWLLQPQVRLTARMLRSRRVVAAQARAMDLPPHARAALAESLRAMSPSAYRRIVEEVADYRLPPTLGAVEVPTLVLAGSTESAVIRRAVETIPATMPRAQGRIVPGAGHAWSVQAPDLFNATLRAWIEEPPASSR